jgi:hypothetical protein
VLCRYWGSGQTARLDSICITPRHVRSGERARSSEMAEKRRTCTGCGRKPTQYAIPWDSKGRWRGWLCESCANRGVQASRPISKTQTPTPSPVQKLVSPKRVPAREQQERRRLQSAGNPEAVQKQSTTAPAPSRKIAIKSVTAAERQGREDFKAGELCGKYKIFRSKYNLRESDASLQWWFAYRRAGRLARADARRPRPSRREPLTPGVPSKRNMALLRKVNPPDPDSWR